MRKTIKVAIAASAAFAVVSLGAVAFANWSVSNASAGKLFSTAEEVPERDVALLLGTSPTVGSQPNFFYVERIKATTQLWKLGKVRAILISGDNSSVNYNEPDHMKDDLIAAGIPAEYITCDYAGLRTLDSVLRANLVFGVHSAVIVSQKEHLERALYLASGADLSGVGLVAADAPKWWQIRQHVREALARVKAVIDLQWGRLPRHLGAQVTVKMKPHA